MPRGLVDYFTSTILPLSGEAKFREAAKAGGFTVEKTPDGGRMITKKMPVQDPTLVKPRPKAKFSPRAPLQIASTRG